MTSDELKILCERVENCDSAIVRNAWGNLKLAVEGIEQLHSTIENLQTKIRHQEMHIVVLIEERDEALSLLKNIKEKSSG